MPIEYDEIHINATLIEELEELERVFGEYRSTERATFEQWQQFEEQVEKVIKAMRGIEPAR